MSRTVSPRLVIVFILNFLVLFLLVVPVPLVRANGTTVRYYLQPGDGMAVPKMWYWYPEGATEVDLMVLNMDTLSPQGPLVDCSWCDFVTRPLVDPHRFRSFKVHIYVRWPQRGCCNGDMASDPRISMAIGYASSDLAQIQYTYEDVLKPIGQLAILDFTLSGWQTDLGAEVNVPVSRGMRLIFHFGSDETMLGEDQPCLVPGGIPSFPWNCYVQPTILFGDSQHASYIETDAVELQGLPIPVTTIATVAGTTVATSPTSYTSRVTTAPTSTPVVTVSTTVTTTKVETPQAPDYAVMSIQLSIVTIALVAILAVLVLRRRK